MPADIAHAQPEPRDSSRDRGNAVEVIRGAGLPGVVVHRGGRVSDAFKPHFHGETHIICVLGGSRVQTAGRTRYQLTAGDVLLTPAGEVHEGASQGWSFVAIYCSPEALDLATSELPREQRDSTRGIRRRDPAVLRLAVDLAASLPEAPLACQSAWTSLVASLMRSGAAPPRFRSERAAVRRARDFLDQNLAATVGLQELATVARVSKEYLVRSFTAEFGMSPHAYHINARIEDAKGRLLRGETILEVALTLGFHDQSHFSRHFRRIVGISPGHLARRSGRVSAR